MQPITISVTMDAASFREFSVFDLFRHQKRWTRPLIFTSILLVSAGICMTQIGHREGAGLLTAVLALVALGLPAVYFGTYFYNLNKSIKRMGLRQPKPFYRLTLDDTGLSVWMAGQQDKAEPTHHYAWQQLHMAYRTPNAIYLYVQPTQAFLWNSSLDAAWTLLQQQLPAERLLQTR